MNYLISIQSRLFWVFLIAQLFLFSSVIAPSLVQSAEKTSWENLPGLAVDIAINSEGQAYIAASDGTPWRWDRQEHRWRRMSGKFTRIAAAEDNHPWAINAERELFRYNGLWWEIKNEGVVDVAANAQGNVFITMGNGDIRQWYALRSEWRSITGSAKRIALDMNGQVWIVDPEGKIQSYDGKNWKNYSDIIAHDIAASIENTQIIIDSTGFIHRWDTLAKQWDKVDGITAVNSVAVTPNGDIWAVLESGKIVINGELLADVEQGRVTEPVAVTPEAPTIRPPMEHASTPKAIVVSAVVLKAPTIGSTTPASAITHEASVTMFNGPAVDPATVTSRNPIKFINTRESAASLAIGAEGSVFGLTEGGNILRWSNRLSRFTDFPGSLVRITVDSKGNPWGISSLGRVFRHTGSKWEQIPNVTASDIAAGYDGSVVIVDISGRLFKFNETQITFNAISGNNAALVALEPDGTPWTVQLDNKLVLRCNTSPCKRYPQKAQSIAIGPDGSVYIVSESKKLMQLDRLNDNFQPILITGFPLIENVAVGPQGYPWVISSEDLTLASEFFERDESDDALLAATTPIGGTVGTGLTSPVVSTEISTITFSKNMKFKNINNTLSIGGGDFNILEVGNDGSIWAAVLASGGNKYEKYNENRNRFEAVPFWFATNNITETALSFDVTSNGDFWGNSNGTNIYRVRGQQAVDFTKSGIGYPGVLSVGGDDTVYAIYGTTLYSKVANSNQFKKFSNDTNVRFVSAGSGGELWITNVADEVQQWNGSKFENRPMGKTQLAKSVKVGNGGTVYIVESGVPYKWNAANNSFDKINNIQLTMDGEIAVEADGRLWLLSEMDNTLKRAID